jgi:hypothetical protein
LGEEKIQVLTAEELKAEAVPMPDPKPAETNDDVIEAETVEEPEENEEIVSDVTETSTDKEMSAASESDTGIGVEAADAGTLSNADEAGAEDKEDMTSSANNVISLHASRDESELEKPDEPEEESALDKEPEQEQSVTASKEKDVTEEDADNKVEFPLGRRPDDPGVHPDKEPPKKGFKLF